MRRARAFFIFIAIDILFLGLLYIHSLIGISEYRPLGKDFSDIVRKLKLTDLVLSTDARYTRHPSQADIFSAFQDYPGSIEHFPTGSLMPPPEFKHLTTEIR